MFTTYFVVFRTYHRTRSVLRTNGAVIFQGFGFYLRIGKL